MAFNFDAIIDRRGTNSIKVDYAVENGYPEDVLPMWVADMDFQAPEAAIQALQKAATHGIYGYTDLGPTYFEALQGWFQNRHAWKTEQAWIALTPGVVCAVATAIRAFTEPGDGVLIQQPVYYPFRRQILANGRKVINNSLVYKDGKYEIDFKDFARKVKRAKMFILCSPHNPVGRVWSREELKRMGELCNENGVLVFSDEIHCDFVLPGHEHIVYPRLGKAFQRNCVVANAPSKTFNMAGLQLSNLFIPNARLRARFNAEFNLLGLHMPGIMGLNATEAAYREGGPWMDALIAYLADNVELTASFLSERLPEIRLVRPEGTYLLWLDFSALGLDDTQLEQLIVQKAKLWLDMGNMFGIEGAGFARVNIACPRAVLEQALKQLETAIREVRS